MQRSLFSRMGQTVDLQAMVDTDRGSDNSLASSSRLAHIVMKQLKNGSQLHALHEAAFTLAEMVSGDKQLYLDSLAETFHTLLTNTAKHVMEAKNKAKKHAAPVAKVIKHHLKAKRPPTAAPKYFTPGHVKELIRNASMSNKVKSMLASGVPEDVAMSAAGDVYDPVQGEGGSSEDIWV